MNYKKKRIKSGLSTYTVAKELGVDWKKYQDVENGKVSLEGEYLNKFLKITEFKNAKMIKFNRRQKLNDIKEFIRNGELQELVAKRGYNGMSLASTLNIESNIIKRVLDGKEASDDMNEYVYDFLQNPLNANTNEVEEVSEKDEIQQEDLVKEMRKIKNEKNLSHQDIANATGIPYSTIAHIINGRKAKKENVDKIYNFLVDAKKGEKYSSQTDLEKILEEKGLTKADVAKGLNINYYYVHNLLKGQKIKEDYEKKIADYIMNAEPVAKIKIFTKTEPFELNIEELTDIMRDYNITYDDISKALGISNSYIEKLLHNRIPMCYPQKRKIDEFIRSFQIEEQAEKTEISESDEKVIPETVLDEIMKETVVEELEDDIEEIEEDIDFEEIVEEDKTSNVVELDYFDLLKENAELKKQLTKAEHQIEMYETLVDVIKGLKK